MKTIAQQIKWDFETNGDLVIKDKNGKEIYYESSNGFWLKYEWDSQGKEAYYQDSKGNRIYYESSFGKIIDNLPKPCENKVIVIGGEKYKLTKV